MRFPLYFICCISFFITSCKLGTTQESVGEQSKINNKTNLIHVSGNTIKTRFAPPEMYTRPIHPEISFANYLQNLPLKTENSLVKYYNGDTKYNNDVYDAVVNLPIGKKDLHQCADAIMRLRAEHLWEQKKFDKIHFNFTNGFQADYSEWMTGKRMIVEGNKTYWNDRNKASNTYQDFWDYMELIFMYAGTASLEKELQLVENHDATIGDILIQGGYPGHAVIIVDEAISENGQKVFLLAQSYMPAQEIQVLKNPNDPNISPWYSFDNNHWKTPEWSFSVYDLKRFPE